MLEETPAPPESTHTILGCSPQALGEGAIVVTICAGALYLDFGVDAHHDQRDEVGPDRGRALIPRGATGIARDRHFPMDHEACFTIDEGGLNGYLDAHYRLAKERTSDLDRKPISLERLEQRHAFRGWDWHEGIRAYHFSARDRGGQTCTHNSATGRTCHESA
ncbi:MAG: hypothetical protein ACPGPE_01410, partial [Planctomycetota bacterium]